MDLLNKTIHHIWVCICSSLVILACSYACDSRGDQINKKQIESMISLSAIRHGVDPHLALAIATVESGMNPKAIGSLGEIGLFQLRPEYHDVIQGDIRNNIEVAVKYLAELKVRCKYLGNEFFICYNYGPKRLLKYPRKTKYYAKVSRELKRRKLVSLIARNQ